MMSLFFWSIMIFVGIKLIELLLHIIVPTEKRQLVGGCRMLSKDKYNILKWIKYYWTTSSIQRMSDEEVKELHYQCILYNIELKKQHKKGECLYMPLICLKALVDEMTIRGIC